jgi:hypothetical protein
MIAANRMLSDAIVRYCLRINACAPSLIAFEILCISGVPMSFFNTLRVKKIAKSNARTLIERTRTSSIAHFLKLSDDYCDLAMKRTDTGQCALQKNLCEMKCRRAELIKLDEEKLARIQRIAHFS